MARESWSRKNGEGGGGYERSEVKVDWEGKNGWKKDDDGYSTQVMIA